MSAPHETLTREGLIFELMSRIALREGKTDDSGISGDREYVLELLYKVRAAVDGSGKSPMTIIDDALAKFSKSSA